MPSASTLVKMPHCWKSCVAAQIIRMKKVNMHVCHGTSQNFKCFPFR